MVALAIVVGFILGALVLGWSGAVAGAFVGLIVALALRSRKPTRASLQAPAWQDIAVPSTTASPAPQSAVSDQRTPPLADRLSAIERRLAALERHAGIEPEAAPSGVAWPPDAPGSVAAPAGPDVAAAAALRAETVAAARGIVQPCAAAEAMPASFTRAADGTLQSTAVPALAGLAGRAAVPGAAPAIEPPAISTPMPPALPPQKPFNLLWTWVTGGNLLTRVGVIVLFFGVGFLLKYFAEFVAVPIELKLFGVACVGAALVALGARLGRTRPGYGLSLEGAGAGILYLTTFAAFRLYNVLQTPLAFGLLVAVAVFTVWRAMRTDSQPLAALAIAGGFLAPFLVSRSPGSPLLLFGYFAVLNAAIFALAWVRAWRALNVLGFVFTFALAMFWGDRFYRPEHLPTVEPFLLLFFAFYVTIAILYAKKSLLQHKAPVDALLVFGVPLLGFALQAQLVHDMRYGTAWSAVAVAAVYAALSAAMFRRPEPGLRLLARAFLVLAIIFATIAIPFAADPRWTSAWWALEAAAVYWIGCRQRQVLARVFALLLQAGAAVYFLMSGIATGDHLFLNATFLGTALIALAAIGTAYVADHHRDVISAPERQLMLVLMMWGLGWWYGGGALELSRALPAREEANAILAFAVASVALALLLRRVLQWNRLIWFGAPLLPLMAVVGFEDWERMRSTLLAYGWLIWPLAWTTHWWALRAADAGRAAMSNGPAAIAGSGLLKHAHTASAIAVVAWLAWEGSEWVGRVFPVGTVWVACAAAWPAIGYLAVIASADTRRWWPLRTYADAYVSSAATAVAALLAVWFAIVNVVSPGDTDPLPFLPLLNALDITLVATLAALFVWARGTARVEEKALYGWFGAALFLLINAIAFRTAHQWLDVPWRMGSLLSSKPLQAALTLLWTATALPLMVIANKRRIRPLWMVGAGLLAVVVGKLFLVDLGGLSGLSRVVAFLGVGILLLLIGYLAPLPPSLERRPSGH